MQPVFLPPTRYAPCYLPPAFDYGTTDPLADLLASTDPLVWFAELSPQDPSVQSILPLNGIMAGALGKTTWPFIRVRGGALDLRLGTVSYLSKPTDTPANAIYRPKLTAGYQ